MTHACLKEKDKKLRNIRYRVQGVPFLLPDNNRYAIRNNSTKNLYLGFGKITKGYNYYLALFCY